MMVISCLGVWACLRVPGVHSPSCDCSLSSCCLAAARWLLTHTATRYYAGRTDCPSISLHGCGMALCAADPAG